MHILTYKHSLPDPAVLLRRPGRRHPLANARNLWLFFSQHWHQTGAGGGCVYNLTDQCVSNPLCTYKTAQYRFTYLPIEEKFCKNMCACVCVCLSVVSVSAWESEPDKLLIKPWGTTVISLFPCKTTWVCQCLSEQRPCQMCASNIKTGRFLLW